MTKQRSAPITGTDCVATDRGPRDSAVSVEGSVEESRPRASSLSSGRSSVSVRRRLAVRITSIRLAEGHVTAAPPPRVSASLYSLESEDLEAPASVAAPVDCLSADVAAERARRRTTQLEAHQQYMEGVQHGDPKMLRQEPAAPPSSGAAVPADDLAAARARRRTMQLEAHQHYMEEHQGVHMMRRSAAAAGAFGHAPGPEPPSRESSLLSKAEARARARDNRRATFAKDTGAPSFSGVSAADIDGPTPAKPVACGAGTRNNARSSLV